LREAGARTLERALSTSLVNLGTPSIQGSPASRDVLIEIKYAGVCHSDIHTIRGDWGAITYPQVVGHEIVGVVAEVGSEVTLHQIGDRVGVGCMVNSCRQCENCLAGMEQYCLKGNVQTYAGVDVDGTITQGGTRRTSSWSRTSC
jgi:uncharacterized zinc-type alcohol dehydrogenase-like protein